MPDEFSRASADLAALARKAFSDIDQYPAEGLMCRAAATPSPAFVGQSHDFRDPFNDPDPKYSDRWGKSREIRAKVIRWLCVNREARLLIDPSGIGVLGARISDQLNLDYADIQFPISLEACFFEREVSLYATKIPMFDLGRSRVPSLNANLIEVRNSIYLNRGFYCSGAIDLVAARIGGYLELQEATIDPRTAKRNNDVSIDAENIAVGGNILLSAGSDLRPDKRTPFQAFGMVKLFGAKIAGDLDCRGAQFLRPGDTALDLGGAVIKGNLFLNTLTEEAPLKLTAEADLRGCSVGVFVFEDDQTKWHYDGGLRLEGFVYERLLLPGKPRIDADTMLRWLSLDRSDTAQPYRQLAKVLNDYGDTEGGKRALIAMEAKLSKGDSWGVHRIKESIDYGYSPENAIYGLGIVTVIGSILLWRGNRMGGMAPTDKDALESYQPDRNLPRHYPRFNPFVHSFENTFPVIKLGQADKWQAARAPADSENSTRNPWQRIRLWTGSGPFLRVLIWIQIVVGWILATLFVAGISGFIHR